MKIIGKIVIVFVIVSQCSCFTLWNLHSMKSSYSPKVFQKFETAYVNENNDLIVNFEAIFSNSDTLGKYHIKINLDSISNYKTYDDSGYYQRNDYIDNISPTTEGWEIYLNGNIGIANGFYQPNTIKTEIPKHQFYDSEFANNYAFYYKNDLDILSKNKSIKSLRSNNAKIICFQIDDYAKFKNKDKFLRHRYLLIPLTVAADIATSPLQIIGYVILKHSLRNLRF